MFYKYIAAVVVPTVFLWVMPLGAFITPSQESTVCNGMRPMHMCMMGLLKAVQKSPSVGSALANASADTQRTKSTGSSETQTLSSDTAEFPPRLNAFDLYRIEISARTGFISRTIEHPPKSAL